MSAENTNAGGGEKPHASWFALAKLAINASHGAGVRLTGQDVETLSHSPIIGPMMQAAREYGATSGAIPATPECLRSDAALSAHSTGSGGVAAEPVAWAWEVQWEDQQPERRLAENRPHDRPFRRNIRPLYEHPPVAAEPVAGWKLVPVEPTQAMWAAYWNTDEGSILFHAAYRAMLAAAPTPPAGGGETDNTRTAKAVAEAVQDGGWWKSCTGCHETMEGHETGHYPYSELFNCHVGGGCSECGGIGVVWEQFTDEDEAALMAEMSGENLRPSPASPAGDLISLSAGATAHSTQQVVDHLRNVWNAHKKGSMPQEYEYGYEAALLHVSLAAQSAVPPAPRKGPSEEEIAALKLAVKLWHQDTCYPTASDGELDIGAERIIALLAPPRSERDASRVSTP